MSNPWVGHIAKPERPLGPYTSSPLPYCSLNGPRSALLLWGRGGRGVGGGGRLLLRKVFNVGQVERGDPPLAAGRM
jgi:hypothetical protein